MRRPLFRLTELETRATPAAFGAAPGGQPLVSVTRADGTEAARFLAFEAPFRGGVRAAQGELDGDPNTLDVVAAAGPGGGPAVKVFSVDAVTGSVTTRAAFFAFEPTFTGGVRVAVGNVLALPTGRGQIVVGAGEGGGPRVRTLDIDGNPVADSPLADFFAYEPSFRGGVGVTAGELDGRADDGDELATVAGVGGGPRVRVLRSDGAVLADYFAFRSDFRGGVNVSVQTSTLGRPSTLKADALALDPSQRNAGLNAAALPVAGGSATPGPVSQNTQASAPGIQATGAVGVSANTGAVGISVSTGASGVSGNVLPPGGVTASTGATGITAATGSTGVSQNAAAGNVGGVGVGTTAVQNTQATNLGGNTSATGVGSNTGTGLTAGTGTVSLGVGQNALATAAPVGAAGLTGFGPFGDPGPALPPPALAAPPYVPGRRTSVPV